ncbi:hypothetical protein ACFOED_10540 [Vulcaniibacterium thermophilum]|uniref:Uncharacterized protein n=1 Tax=Vulcaniibacterium thermophilum TaxID=1169913 RepID=A0A918YVV7_9GAMM|nr:hypothetical protein [Vulcaniibacterium thermophilum]GHE27152.1 hypothetical protein GCM10007167_05560 [Vulcaniibacterium thermophilum]
MLSTAVLSWRSRRETGRGATATNATSHWVWGEPAMRRREPSVRHTALGYAIHHASSIFWAVAFERLMLRKRASVARTTGTAAAVSAMAYAVDYGLTPKRLTPGFERHLDARGMLLTYAAVAAGFALTALARRRR